MAIKTSMFDMTGKVVLVTGGTSGIGYAIAKAMLEHGARILVGSRDAEKTAAAVRELDAVIPNDDDDLTVAGVSLDVTKEESVQRSIHKAVDVFGGLHAVVNSAGVMCKKPTFELTSQEVNELYDVHVTGALRVSQAAGHVFREQHEGSIVNIASITSYVALTHVAAYAAAKSGMMGLTRSLANEWAAYGIRTNGIAPGFIPTDMNRKLIEGTDRGRRILENTPMARFGTGEEVAGAAVYLCSPAAKFVNGHTIVVDGGYLACGVGDTFAPWAEPDEPVDS